MLVDGEILTDGMDVIRYLDRRLQETADKRKVVTGIIIGTEIRKELTKACQHVMSTPDNPSETINRFMNVLLIEDGMNPTRLEVVVSDRGALKPIEGNAFMDEKRIGRRYG